MLTYGLIVFMGWCGWQGWKRFRRWKSSPPDSHTPLCVQLWDQKQDHPLLEFAMNVPNEEVEESLYQIQTLSCNPIFLQHCSQVHWVTVRTTEFILMELRLRYPFSQ